MLQVFSSIKLYLCVVLLPQLLYLLTNRHGWAAVCESCSPATSFELYLQSLLLRSHPSPSTEPGHLSTLGDACPALDLDGAATVIHTERTRADLDKDLQCYSDDETDQGVRDDGQHQDGMTDNMCSCSVTKPINTSGNADRDAMPLDSSSDNWREGGWYIPHSLPDLTGPCNIKRRNISLTQMDFLERFAFTEPVILTGISDQAVFRSHSTKWRLLQDYGSELITVATANTHSYRKVKMTFCEYVERYMKPQSVKTLGNETFYHFGDNDRERWDLLFSLYQLPPYQLPGMEPVLSFGLAGPGTGVPFHIHGPTFAETIFGRKRWFLYPPNIEPHFHPDVTTLHWVSHTYPNLQEEEKPLECTLNPGEVIYFPDRWWHATLNLDAAVFMSTFYS